MMTKQMDKMLNETPARSLLAICGDLNDDFEQEEEEAKEGEEWEERGAHAVCNQGTEGRKARKQWSSGRRLLR